MNELPNTYDTRDDSTYYDLTETQYVHVVSFCKTQDRELSQILQRIFTSGISIKHYPCLGRVEVTSVYQVDFAEKERLIGSALLDADVFVIYFDENGKFGSSFLMYLRCMDHFSPKKTGRNEYTYTFDIYGLYMSAEIDKVANKYLHEYLDLIDNLKEQKKD